jgi:hypothetical protein
MKLSLKGTPKEVSMQLFRLEIQIAMTDVAMRMARLAVRCGRGTVVS